MKAAAVLFLCLFISLLGGSESVHATGHDTLRSYSPALHVDGPEQTHTLKMRLAMLPVRNHHLSDKKESMNMDVDDDDEQDDLIFAGKYFLPVACFISLAGLWLLDSSQSTVKTRLPFCAHFSYTSSQKYIFQRVLRI